jgi:peroxiredoxin
MLELGTPAPAFSLPEPATGETVSSDQFSGRPLLVAFICNHCPFVKHIQGGFAAFAAEYQAKGLAVAAISSNDVTSHPDDGPEQMAEEARLAGYDFPYLFDASQEVAKAYRAACTPDFFLFDRGGRLVYRGQFDGARPGNDVPVSGRDMRAAADAVLAGRQPAPEQQPSLGCNIKWRAGNEPDYYG